MKSSARVLAILCGIAFLLPHSSPAQADTARVVAAANKFLDTLTPDQRKKVQYDFNDAAQRARWSNFPTGVVPRGGIPLKQMTQPQQDAAMALMATVLSPMGMQKVNEIREADDDFKVNGSQRGPGGGGGRPGGPPSNSNGANGPQGRGPGGPGGPGGQGGAGRPNGPGGPGGQGGGNNFSFADNFGKDLYYISFLGTPSTTAPWMLQFGGHHLALNITIAGARGILTPSLTGAQPATFQLNGKTVRPVGRESDKALALLQSLDDTQRKQAVLSYAVTDLVLGPGQDDKKISPEGLKVSAMNAKQQAMLLDLIGEWAGIINQASAAARMAELKADLKDTYFAWSGPTTGTAGTNITAYYRVQGPHLVIEYSPQRDEPTNHVHTIYRDPTNDYGRAAVSK